MFGIETEPSPKVYTRPESGGVDDVTIRGLPHNFSLATFSELVQLEFTDRNEYMPHVIYSGMTAESGSTTLRAFFKEPIDHDLMLEVFCDCADSVMESLRIPTDDIVLSTSRTGLYAHICNHGTNRNPSNRPDAP